MNNASNISIDPQFVNPESEDPDGLRLALTSPAIDAGDNRDKPVPMATVDFEGKPRFLDIPAVADTGYGTAPIVDMGAYEAMPSTPQAEPDRYNAKTNFPLKVGAPGVLQNDGDPGNNPLTAALDQPPAHGHVALNADGSFIYIPAQDYTGPESFTYHAGNDLFDSGPVEVQINVAPNHKPVGRPDFYHVETDSRIEVEAPGVLANDTDEDGDLLNAILVSTPDPSLWSYFDLTSDGHFAFDTVSGASGIATATYVVSDGYEQSDPITINFSVYNWNEPPTAGDDTFTVLKNTPLTIPAPGVLRNDSDPNPGQKFWIEDKTTYSNAAGYATINNDGSFSFTPNPDYVGSGVKVAGYYLTDGIEYGSYASVYVNVVEQNAPAVTTGETYTIPQDFPLNLDALNGLLVNDSDPEGNPLTATLHDVPERGTVTVNLDGSFAYQPPAGFTGTDTFTYTVNDGIADSGPVRVFVNIFANARPVAMPDAYQVAPNQVLTVATPGVLANDYDPDGGSLMAFIADQPAHGTLALNMDGSFTYTPEEGFTGEDHFTYRPMDAFSSPDPVTVTITVAYYQTVLPQIATP